MSMTDTQRARVIEAAQGWLNTPYTTRRASKGLVSTAPSC